MLNLYHSAADKPRVFNVESKGGYLLAGILIGRLIYDAQMDVRVKRRCYSSCANYIFPAGHKKYLGTRALVIFHGGFYQSNMQAKLLASLGYQVKEPVDPKQVKGKEASTIAGSSDERRLSRKYFPERSRYCSVNEYKGGTQEKTLDLYVELSKACDEFGKEVEAFFYEKIGVDPMLPYYGQRGKYYDLYKSYRYQGFYYDLKGFGRMNVNNIIEPKRGWKPEKSYMVKKVYKVKWD